MSLGGLGQVDGRKLMGEMGESVFIVKDSRA